MEKTGDVESLIIIGSITRSSHCKTYYTNPSQKW